MVQYVSCVLTESLHLLELKFYIQVLRRFWISLL